MFKAKITKMEETEAGMVQNISVVFSDGNHEETKVFMYNEFKATTKEDICNLLAQECQSLDEKYDVKTMIKELVGIEDVVEILKVEIASEEVVVDIP